MPHDPIPTRASVAVLAALAALLGAALPAMAEPERYELDPAHTTIAFTVDHVGYADVLGLFGQVEGGFTYDRETRALSGLEVRVVTASVETLNAERDGHVRSGDFLDVESHATMTFTALEGTPAGVDGGSVTGELTLLGQTHPLTLDVTLNKAAEYPFGHQRFTLGISARGALMRSDYGMAYGVENGLVGDRVEIVIETEAMRID